MNLVRRCRSHCVWLPVFLQLCIFGFGLLVDGKIRIGIFPTVKKFFVRFTGG